MKGDEWKGVREANKMEEGKPHVAKVSVWPLTPSDYNTLL